MGRYEDARTTGTKFVRHGIVAGIAGAHDARATNSESGLEGYWREVQF